jgi:hypothetical protein
MSFTLWVWKLTVRSVALALALCGALHVGTAHGADPNSLEKPTNASEIVVAPAPQSRKPPIRPQISHVGVPVANHYLKADSVGLALAIVPDPLVPRYGRLFDLHVLALELGMLKDGYVLDRFSFPWSDELRRDSDPTSKSTDSLDSNISSGSYGLMIFRCDAWRGDACNYPGSHASKPEHPALGHTRIRALYIVTDTATSGVSRFAFECAIRRMETDAGIMFPDSPTPSGSKRQCPESTPKTAGAVVATLLNHSQCPSPPAGGHNVVVLGPNFSGAMNSIGETVEGRIPDANRQVCLVSSSASDRTNVQVSQKYPTIIYKAIALDNGEKLQHLDNLTGKLGAGGKREVAILAEASTFGYGICHGVEQAYKAHMEKFCDRSIKFFFPPTISDIAYGIHKQQAQEASDLVNATRQVQDDRHVSLVAGAENGSEFPENESPAVTAASNQLQLDQVMDALAALAPKVVVVAATDVRDRLFLFDQLREKLPRAMLVDLEADNLLAHPEFLHASRGAIAMASVNLNSTGSVFPGCGGSEVDTTRASWSTDVQGMLADSTAHLYESDMDVPVSSLPCGFDVPGKVFRQAALHVVTFNGFKPVSLAFPDEAPREGEAHPPRFHRLILTELLAVLFIAALAALWLWPWSLQGRRQARDHDHVKRRERYFVGFVLVCGTLFLSMALVVAYHSTNQIGHPFMYSLVAVEAIGIFAAWRCYSQVRTTFWAARHAAYSAPWLSIVLATFSIGIAGAAAWVSYHLDSSERLISIVLVNALGFDPSSGLAFYLVAAVAAITTLYASAIIATRTWVVRRNFRLLFLAREAARRSRSSVHPPTSFVPLERKRGAGIHSLQGYKPLSMWVTVLICVLIYFTAGAPGLLDYLGGPRLTVFGPAAAYVAVMGLAATTLCGSILLIAAYGAGRRVISLCGYVRGRVLENMDSMPASGEIPGLWAGGREMPNAFPATPVLAVDCAAGRLSYGFWVGRTDDSNSSAEEAGRAWASELSKIMYQGVIDSRTRFALFALLVSELSLFRWIAVGAVLSAFASVGIVFFYPIEADTLLILNLLILALAGLLCAYLAVVFERDGVLSNVVCNRPQKAQISVGLFSFIASPFVALAVAIALVEIPGVVDWAGGLFVMVRTLGIHP